MIQMKTLLLLLLFTSVPVTFADPPIETQNERSTEETSQEQEDYAPDVKGLPELAAEAAIEGFLGRYEGLYIPALPTFSVNFGDAVSISLALAQLNLTGIGDVTVTEADLLGSDEKLLELTIPIVALNFGHYSSGGHILNLPFSGEGSLLIALHNLYIKVHYNTASSSSGNICVKAGSTSFDLDLPRFEVEFTNMNPGTDLGQLLNIILSSFGADIVDYLEILVNGQFKDATEQLFIDIVNTYSSSCEDWVSDRPLDDMRMEEYLNDLLQHYLKAFKVPGSIRTV